MNRPLVAVALVAASLQGATAASPAAFSACGSPPRASLGPLGAVAYLRGRALHVVDLSSGRDRTLARLPRQHMPIAWSPDGRWISAGDLLLPAAGGSPCRPFGPGFALDWASRGGLLAGTSSRGEVVAGRVGQRPRRLLPKGWGIGGFDPAGTRLAALGPDRSVVIVDVASGARRLVYRSPSYQVGSPVFARWSPDGRWLFFWTDSFDSGSIAADGLPLWAVSRDGGRAFRIERAVLLTQDFVQACGSRRLIVSAGPDRYVSARKSIQLLAPPSWSARNLSADSSRSWYAATCTPDGSLIAATVTRNVDEGIIDSATRTIWLLTRDGKRRLLVAAPGRHVSVETPRFSRDGRFLLYVQHAARYGARGRLYLLDVATGKRRGPFAAVDGGVGYYGLHDWTGASPWYR